MNRRTVTIALLTGLVLLVVPTAFAGKGGGGGGKPGGGGGSCTQKTPAVIVDNTWAWGSPGSYGLPGQQLTYGIDVINYDAGCGSSSFVVSIAAPSGFSVSLPTNTISLSSASSGYLWTKVTSPSAIADGDYPLTVTVQRAGSTQTASYVSKYKVYSSDAVAPTLFWPSPADGTTVSGRSYYVAVSSSDDHAVKQIDLYIDGAFKTTAACDDISSTCQLGYNWSPGGTGQHTATFKSYDWLGNVGVLTTAFTVS